MDIMPATLERTVTLDRNLAQRADRKLRRYGHSFDEAVTAMMNAIVSQRGELPMQEFNSTEELIADCLA